ncbi:MAG: RluA family pseudouridine synthase [Proteobacteria bacterium]|nr:RluA family pseudouridine synthase [Pseudomonadota bacterium]
MSARKSSADKGPDKPAPLASVSVVTVAPGDAGTRLDRLLATALPNLSRSRLKALILSGSVTRAVNQQEKLTDPAHRVKPGEAFRVEEPAAADPVPRPQDIPLLVVYEDDDLIVIDKPAGLVVHPAAGNPDGTLVNALLHHCGESLSGIGGVRRPGIVHRIDKDTSGLMVAAKNDRAHRGLAAQFEAHSVERAYLAVVRGAPRRLVGRIEGNIGRHPVNRKKMAVVETGGKAAVTHYKTLEVFAGPAAKGGARSGALAALVECRLETGRTHQVRVHMASIGHPLIGDPLYGRAKTAPKRLSGEARAALGGFPRQALHAYVLGFTHPISQKPFKFSSKTPDDMETLISALRGA